MFRKKKKIRRRYKREEVVGQSTFMLDETETLLRKQIRRKDKGTSTELNPGVIESGPNNFRRWRLEKGYDK